MSPKIFRILSINLIIIKKMKQIRKNINQKKSKRILWRLGFCLFVFLSLFLSLFLPRKWIDSRQESCNFQVCVAKFGIHTKLIVEIENQIFDWQKYLPLEKLDRTKDLDDRYLGFGRGAENWYIAPPSQLNDQIIQGLQALFLPNSSVIGVQKYNSFPNADEIKCTGVSSTDYLNLMNYLKNSFQTNRRGETIRVANNSGDRVSFYAAKGTYSLLNNSNSWTAKGLRVANLNTPLVSGISEATMLHLDSNCSRNSQTDLEIKKELLTMLSSKPKKTGEISAC
jgi:uncharacterized protein (TIGR02117 family)